MKKLLLSATLFLLPITSFASGPYDGIYSMNLNGFIINYMSIHENENNMVAIIIESDPNDATWEALNGIRTNNTAGLRSILGTVDLDVSVTFNNNGTASALVNSCNGECDLPGGSILSNGSVLDFVKVF